MSTGKKILIIDDDATIVDHLQLLLKSKGLETISCANGIEGMNMARDNKPDLIILDVMMPGITGYQVCALLKGDASLKNIPIVMLTARVRDEDLATGQKVGVNAYLKKPIDVEQVLSTVASQLNIDLLDTETSDEEDDIEEKMARLQKEYMAELPGKLASAKQDWAILQQKIPTVTNQEELNGQFSSIKRIVHNISGTAANFGLEKLGEIAQKLDKELKLPLEERSWQKNGSIDQMVAALESAAKDVV